MHTNTTVALKPNFMLFDVFLYICIFFSPATTFVTLKIQKRHNKETKIFTFYIFGLNAVFC